MKIAIFSRPGPCFPNVISKGLSGMLTELGVENEILYEGIPMLMRLLPLSRNPKRWHNNLQFRIRNKLKNYFKDRNLLRKISQYDALVISECYPNAFWKDYFAVNELRNRYTGKIISYTEGPLDSAPENRKRTLFPDDYDESLFDFNLFVTRQMEVKVQLNSRQAEIGVSLDNKDVLRPKKKDEFIAVIDFRQEGFDDHRSLQIETLRKLGIKTVILEGKYAIQDIRKIYAQASIFFLAFPETFGLPIAECLSCGVTIFTPESAWPMSWRLNEAPESGGPGELPGCFQVYSDSADLERKIDNLRNNFSSEETPKKVFLEFIKYYSKFYYGDKTSLEVILAQLNSN